MRGVQRVGYFNGNLQQLLRLHRPAHDFVLQGGAIQKLHGDERLPVLLADVVDGADVRMV